MADTEITALQVKDSLDSYVNKMNILTGDITTAPQRIQEFLDRFGGTDLIGALGKVEDSFGQAKSLLLQAQQCYQQAEGELNLVAQKIDSVDWDAFTKNQQTIDGDYEEIRADIEANSDKEHALELLLSAAQKAIELRATKEELAEQTARVNEATIKFSNLLFDVQNLNEKLSASIKADERRLDAAEADLQTKMEIENCYDKGQADTKFAFKEEIPTLAKLNGVDKDYAQETYAQSSDMKKVRVALFGEDGDQVPLTQKVQELNLNKAESNDVYSRTAADLQFARKDEIVPEDSVRTIVDDEIRRNVYDASGNPIFITRDTANKLIKQDVALEVISVLRKYGVITDPTPPLDGATEEEKKELENNTGSPSAGA